MPRPKSKTSKSSLIREALKATPEKPAAELAKEFGASTHLVYNIISTERKKNGKAPATGRRRKARRKHAAKVAAPKGAHDALDSAFEFINKVGGLLHAEQLIGKLKAIKERL